MYLILPSDVVVGVQLKLSVSTGKDEPTIHSRGETGILSEQVKPREASHHSSESLGKGIEVGMTENRHVRFIECDFEHRPGYKNTWDGLAKERFDCISVTR